MGKGKSKGKKFNKRNKFGKKKGKSQGVSTMVNKTSAKLHTLIAPKFLTKVTTNVTGFTNGTTNSGGCIVGAVSGNSIYLPLNAGNQNTSTPITYALDDATNMTTIILSTQSNKQSWNIQPFGFSSVLLNMYRQFRVMGAKIKVTIVPRSLASTTTAQSNAYELCVYPYRIPSTNNPDDESMLLTSFAPPALDTTLAQNMPYSKYKLIQLGSDVKNGTIEMFIHSHTILGMKKDEYRIRKDVVCQFDNSNDPESVNQIYTPEQQQWAFAIVINQFNTSASAVPLDLSVELVQWVVCENPVQMFENV